MSLCPTYLETTKFWCVICALLAFVFYGWQWALRDDQTSQIVNTTLGLLVMSLVIGHWHDPKAFDIMII